MNDSSVSEKGEALASSASGSSISCVRNDLLTLGFLGRTVVSARPRERRRVEVSLEKASMEEGDFPLFWKKAL